GILNVGGTLAITGSTIRDNGAYEGGGIASFHPSDVSLTITDSIVSANSANFGGGIYATTVEMSGSLVADNAAMYEGAGILIQNLLGASTIANSPISRHKSPFRFTHSPIFFSLHPPP